MKIGEKFNFKGFEWVVLDEHDFNGEKAVTAIMTKAWDTAAFDEDNRNDWKTSSARKSLQEELLPVLGEENLISRSVDLVADNGDRRYGRTDDKIWLLSCDDFRNYRETILANCDFQDEWWWTLTPWDINDVEYGSGVRTISPSGNVNNNYADSRNGVAPACVFHLASLASALERSDCDGVRAGVERVLDRLKEYEELGLTPEQLRQIDQLYREKCEELARYKAAIAEARKVQRDDKLYLHSYNQGWKGALELIERAIKEASE